jgi:type 1 glutamine amidotransferase
VTDFPVAPGPHEVNGRVAMPVAYVKGYGAGRVYYSALGHKANVIDQGAPAEMLRRGLIWAVRR